MKKAIMSILTVWIMVSSMFIGLIGFSGIETVKAPYIPHNAIRINNNTEFASMAGLEGWTGDGSPGNPYIIEGYDINGSGYGYCIYIGNTTLYFEVKDSYLHEASGVGNWPYYTDSGIILHNVQNGNVANNNASSNIWFGINLYSSNNNTITNNNASSNNEVGIYLYSSNSNTISNNNASNNEIGIYLYSSNSNTISNNNASNNDYAIYLYSSNSNTIANNNASNNDYAINLYSSNNNTITNSTASSNKYNGIILRDSDNNTIANNNASSNIEDGIYLSSSNSNTITNNTASNNWDGIFLSLESSSNIITNNTISSNNEHGIFIIYSNKNSLANNTISSNNWFGIYLYLSISHTIINNEMRGDGIFIWSDILEHWNSHIIDTTNTVNGKPVHYWKNQTGGTVPLGAGQVILANSTNVVVENQNLSHGSVGIELGFSSNNTLTNNNASNNDYGILLSYANSNTIDNNNISNNEYGIYMFVDSSDNSIYHNNIINNTYQVDDNYDNQWDDGYPLGGNYWSDYIGVDNFKGPYQDIPGSDGIGDTPYIVDSDTQDNYPLMQPYKPLENYIILKQGWNLISIPLIQKEQNLTRVLGSIDGWYDAVQWYDSSNPNKPWNHHKVGKPFGNVLFHLNESMGFWIHITNPGDTIFLYNGTQPTSNESISLHPGWNMVGYPSLTNRNRTAALNNITFGSEVDAIWTFNNANKNWVEINGADYFEVGRGYWIHATQECVWEVGV